MIRERHSNVLAGLLLLSSGLLSGCQETGDPVTGPALHGPEVAVAFEDIVVLKSEVEACLTYIFSVHRSLGQTTARHSALIRHLIPLKLAQKDHQHLRATQRQSAEALVRVVGNGGPAELAMKGQPYGGQTPDEGFARSDLPFGLRVHMFDTSRLGHVELVELPQGFAVAASSFVHPGASTPFDRAEGTVVPFYTHTESSFQDWLGPRMLGLRGKLDYVDNEYRNVLQDYL